jgi:hypothetical protein
MPGTIMGLFALDPLATQRVRSIAVLAVVVVVIVGLLGWAAHATGREAIVFVGCAALLVVGVLRATSTYEERYVQPDPSAVEEVEAVLADRPGSADEGIVCAMTAGCPLLNFYRYQFYLPDRDVDLTWDESWRGADVVLAGQAPDDAALLGSLGFALAWADPTSEGALWVR